ncbi:MAG: SBBP repeat-containing protein [Candidatus Krumholzibacteria bacterium]|nr:SBBP repeat-containing protein [Candidatus Krumholzibacteria bacterium]MDH5270865.1 SBBP repeat-containing protein [Candidatus Krumholzibacteria bacterium]
MKRFALPLLCILLLAPQVPPAAAATPAHLWSQRLGGTDNDSGFGIATDASGNVYFTGAFEGTVDFGDGPVMSAGLTDVFLVKYDAAGTYLWSQAFGDPGFESGISVATDASGNVFMTGYFDGTVNFGGGPLVSAGGYDIFVAKYGPDGTHLWSQGFGDFDDDMGYAVATDASGNVIVTGHFSEVVDFGGGPLVSNGFSDIFVAKYSPTGTHLWSQAFGGTNFDDGNSVATDASGNVFVTGSFWSVADFGGGPVLSAGFNDIFVAKYSPLGAHLWSQTFGNGGSDVGRSVATDASGNVFVTGHFSGTVDFGGGPLVSAGSNDIVLAGYSPTGTHLWSRRFGGTSSDSGNSVATDASGNVFMTGIFRGTVDFGGGPLVSAGDYDIVIARYGPTGTHRWSRRFGSNGPDNGRSLATTASGNVLLTGDFGGTVDFGGGPLVSAGSGDILVTRYAGNPLEPVITSIADIGNDQGGKVKIRFERSGADDALAGTPVTRYAAFRRDDAPPAAVAPGERVLLEDGWTQVGWVDAFGNSTYGIDVPTIGDSTQALGQYYSTFLIRAATNVPTVYFDSPADSGYSIDNLAPGVPGGLLYNSGVLSWNESPAADFDYFTVYGANVDDFGSATIVDYTIGTGMDVTASPWVYYFVTATDFSGNEGLPVKVNTASGVGGTPQSYVLSVSNYPNPFNPRTTVSYTVPSRGNVTVAIYDARGARVATLVENESREAGAYRMEWNGRTDASVAASSGVYFARIEHAGLVRTKKMVLLK